MLTPTFFGNRVGMVSLLVATPPLIANQGFLYERSSGRLVVAASSTSTTAAYLFGLAFTAEGALIVNNTGIVPGTERFNNGFFTSPLGEILVDNIGVINSYMGGLPFIGNALASDGAIFGNNPFITTLIINPMMVTRAFSQQLAAVNGSPPYTWASLPTPPAGILLSTTGLLSGTPTSALTYNYGAQVTDTVLNTGTRSYTSIVADNLVQTTPSPLPTGQVGVPYSQQLAGTGGTAPLTYTAPSLPDGLSISATGLISGTPTAVVAAQSYNITVTDANNFQTIKSYQMTITPAAFNPASLFAAGEKGAWYDTSDLSTLFQDTAGTIPVTANGQFVRYISDKSGNGNHLTSTNNAIYQNGTIFYTPPDYFYHALMVLSGTKTGVWANLNKADDNEFRPYMNHATINAFEDDAFIYYAPNNNTAPDFSGYAYLSATRASIVSASSYPAGTTYTVNTLMDYAVPSISLSINGISQGTGIGDPPSTFKTLDFYLGAQLNDVIGYIGSIGQVIIRNAQSTAQEISDTTTWMISKQ